MEMKVFASLDYCLGIPIPYRFLRRFAKVRILIVHDIYMVVERQFPPSWIHPSTGLLLRVVVTAYL